MVDPFFSWLESYLRDRKQQVLINGNISDKFDVHSGVPQGGYLFPLLFLIYFNDIRFSLNHSQYSLFSDDLKVNCMNKDRNDYIQLQNDFGKFNNKCKINGLSLNTEKCFQITFIRYKYPTLFEYSIN